MEEVCTLYHAIALLAYRDDRVARRYGAKRGVRTGGREKRQLDLISPTTSGLPGTETFEGIKDEQQLQARVQQWADRHEAQWNTAKTKLANSVRLGDVPAFRDD